ncbi:hypothetical protein HPT25_15435 [Bacillus sp. BRMEA1]|uniref:hypothetical protein n=1 Tax=Neobacillus endophyticus TaxID=2738405 RepID=UPI001564655A|nr:hypothetical protein [Neobacillus endophyticus]NRD78754.1 hypothetical protein [Neobacillus endophyticus]
MVTAIVIPIICFYFYWLTKKEMKEYDRKWMEAGNVPKEAFVTGIIKSITEERQRFYYHRHLFIQTLHLQTSTKMITAQKTTPITKNMEKNSFHSGENIHIYGTWKGNIFNFSDYEIEPSDRDQN